MSSLPVTSKGTTINLTTCQKICVSVGLEQVCGSIPPGSITSITWVITSGASNITLSVASGVTPTSAVIFGLNPGSATVQVSFFLNGLTPAAYIINIPVIVTQDQLVSTFSFGPATLITSSFLVPCGSGLPTSNFQVRNNRSQFLSY